MSVLTFEEWAAAVDALCRRHFAASWSDLAGDLEPLQRAFESAETPDGFVRWLAEKYGLLCVDSVPLGG